MVAYVFHAESSHGLLHFKWVLVWFGDFGFLFIYLFIAVVLFLRKDLSRVLALPGAHYRNQAILKPPSVGMTKVRA